MALIPTIDTNFTVITLIIFGCGVVFICFLGCLSTERSHFTVGKYSTGQDIKATKGLTELTQEEYLKYKSSGMHRIFPGEKIWHGEQVNYAGVKWNVDLASVEERIYKICLKIDWCEKRTMEPIYYASLDYFFEKYGVPNEKKDENIGPIAIVLLIWDVPEGNIIYQYGGVKIQGKPHYILMVFFTSKLIR